MKKIPTAIEEDLSSSANQTDSLFNESNEVSADANARTVRTTTANGSATNGHHNGNGYENNGHSITDDEEEVQVCETMVSPQKASSPMANGKGEGNGQNGRSNNKVCS